MTAGGRGSGGVWGSRVQRAAFIQINKLMSWIEDICYQSCPIYRHSNTSVCPALLLVSQHHRYDGPPPAILPPQLLPEDAAPSPAMQPVTW